jgi:hypothetical protein
MELRIGADPVPILRRRGGLLRCRTPRTELEVRYLKFFEEFQIQYDETVPDSDEYDLRQLELAEEVLPVTGEFLQSLCDYTVINRERSHPSIDEVIPRSRQLFVEEDREIIEPASLFIYPEPGLLEDVLQRRVWPKLRLLVVHNGDNQTNYDILIPFLNANPRVHAWLQNNTVTHPQIRSLPIGDQNRMWRGGNGSYEPTVRTSRSADREHGILYPWCSTTNPMRPIWYAEAKLLRSRTDLLVLPRLDKEDYIDALGASNAVVCPPGNGLDTHRHWESLYMGASAIVQNNAHTRCLLHEYPSLPLIPIDSPMDLQSLVVQPAPSPFHPMLLRHYWQVMFRSYMSQDNVVVLLTNAAYSKQCLMTIHGCRTVGNYKGDIVVLTDADLSDEFLKYEVIVKKYDPIDIQPIISKIIERPFTDTDGREISKQIQWQKLNIFHTYFKQWQKIFYMDAGMYVFGDINIFFDLVRPQQLLAHCDDFPEYRTNLAGQFNRLSYPDVFAELAVNYNLERPCFQTGIILFDSSIIKHETISEIMNLAYKYHISRTNEQGILNLYFYDMLAQVPIYRDGKFLYDYWERFGNHHTRYILLKYPKLLTA